MGACTAMLTRSSLVYAQLQLEVTLVGKTIPADPPELVYMVITDDGPFASGDLPPVACDCLCVH